MGEIVNLRQARKAKARAGKEAEAAANRAKFGRSKAEKELEAARRKLAERSIEGHKREE
ncbi:MAG TPA: DUF4169 family protein [Devosia sp.]|nr:DUF4169 family protein [Devosia sp.]